MGCVDSCKNNGKPQECLLPRSFMEFLFLPHVVCRRQGRCLGQNRQSAYDVRNPECRRDNGQIRQEVHHSAESEAADDLKYSKACRCPANALQTNWNRQRLQRPGIAQRYHKHCQAQHNMCRKAELRTCPSRYNHTGEKSKPDGAVKPFPELHRAIFSFPEDRRRASARPVRAPRNPKPRSLS